MLIIVIGFAAIMMAQGIAPVVGAAIVSGLAGMWSSNKASKAQKQAIQAQQAAEAQKAAYINQQLSLADQMLHGQGYVPGQGVDARPGHGGAMELSKSWTDKYLNWLQNSPDITYNAQRGAMEGNIRDSMAAAASALGQRGLSTQNVQSGAALKTMGGIGMQRAGLLSSMEAGRHDRMGERLGMGTQLTQGLMDRALNVRSAALGQALGQQTMVPQMQQGIASQYGQLAQGFGNLTGGLIQSYMNQPQVQAPTTVAMPQQQQPMQMPNQFYSYKPVGPYQSKYWGN